MPEMFRNDESNQRDRGRRGYPPALPMHDMKWLRTLGNSKSDQAVNRVCQGQWRAGKKDPPKIGGQVLKHLGLWELNPPYFWLVKLARLRRGLPAFFSEGQAAAQSHRKDPRIPS